MRTTWRIGLRVAALDRATTELEAKAGTTHHVVAARTKAIRVSFTTIPLGFIDFTRSTMPARRPGCKSPVPRAGGVGSAPYRDLVRLTEFWGRMEERFGATYARSVAADYR